MYLGSLPTASNKARYILTLQVIDEETGDALDLTDIDFTFCIREAHPYCGSVLFTATDGDGVDIIDAATGIIEITFTKAQMRTLYAKQYDVGCTVAADDDDEETDQFIIGTLSVLDGVVT